MAIAIGAISDEEQCPAKPCLVGNSYYLLGCQRFLGRARSFRREMEAEPVPKQNRRSDDDSGIRREQVSFTFSGAGEPESVAADGTDQPAANGTTLSVTVEQPNTWKIVRKKDGQIVITAVWNLSKDGKTLSDAFTANRPDGTTSTVNMVYKRSAGNSGIPGTWETTDVKIDSVIELEIRPYQNNGLSFISASAPPRNINFDGKEHLDPATEPTLGASSLGRRIDERSLEYTNKIKDKIVQARQLTLSPDLKTLTIVVHLADQRLPNTLVFDRA